MYFEMIYNIIRSFSRRTYITNIINNVWFVTFNNSSVYFHTKINLFKLMALNFNNFMPYKKKALVLFIYKRFLNSLKLSNTGLKSV